jgi:pyruvate ferredoxin oxidoreductase alpha subunit
MLETQSKLVPMSGSEAVAKAAIQTGVEFIAAYPITPQTIIVERLSELVASGKTLAKFVNVESEHSAMSACVGASLAGGRVFTATSSQGLALMHEVLYLASGLRCPIVMAVANRALSAPINIHGDHSDMMGSRDSCWIQLYVENAQEAYDWVIQAYKIAENARVSLPFAVNMDGYVITHSVEPVIPLEDIQVAEMLPPRHPLLTLDTKNPMTFGTLTLPDYYTEFKKQQEEAMHAAEAAFTETTTDFAKLTGRQYTTVTPYRTGDAKVIIASLGSASGTIRWVTRKLREQNMPVGALKISLFRPFPYEEVGKLLENADTVVVLERALSLGSRCGPLGSEVVNALYDRPTKPKVLDIVAGLGGRDLAPEVIKNIFKHGFEAPDRKLETRFEGVRE